MTSAESDVERPGLLLTALERFSHSPRIPAIVVIIVTSFALRAVLAATVGFSFDESYDVVAARSVSLGYLDHPPLAMWLIAGAVRLFGSESGFVVRLPTLLLFAGTTWLVYRLTELLFTPRAALIAALALNLSPLFGAFAGTIAVTDGPLLFGLSGAGYFLAEAIFCDERASRRRWVLSGAFFGLAALAKYSAFLAVPGVLLFLFSMPRHRSWLIRPGPYLAVCVALLIFSPAILWNYEHGWTSFVFQGKRAAFDGGVHPIRLAEYFAAVSLFVLPTIWGGLILSVFEGIRRGPGNERRWFLSCLAIVPIAFFAGIWLFGDRAALAGGYHWAAPGYLYAFPLFGAALADLQRSRALAGRLLSLSAAVVSILYFGFVTDVVGGWIGWLAPEFRQRDPLASDQTDWWRLRSALADWHMLDPHRYFIIAGRYELCFKAELVLKGALPVVCLTSNPIGRSLWTDMAALSGRDAVIITSWWNAPQPLDGVKADFAASEPLPAIAMSMMGVPRMKVDLLLAHNLQTRPYRGADTSAPRRSVSRSKSQT